MILKAAFEKLFKIREEAAKARPGADDGFDPHEKPFLDHLEDLRTTLMQMGGTLAISTILCFAFHIQIFKFLQLPSEITKMEDGSTLHDKIDFIFLAPQEGLMLMIKVSFFTAVVISMPLLIFFMFQFILPGLRQMEKKMIIPGAGVGFILFLIGASFAFFLAAPIALKFFFVFENERFGDLNPAAKALEKPIAQLPLLGVGGKVIEPYSKKDAAAEATPTDKPKAEATPTDKPEAEATPADKPKAEATPTDKPKAEATPADKLKAEATPTDKPKAEITPADKPKAETTPTDKLPTASETLTPAMKSAVRGYMIDLLAVQQGKDLVLRYDEARDKIILAHFKGAKSTYQVGKYFEFITRLTLVFGLSFQLPVVVTILVKLELLTARVMRSTRTYAWIIIMVAAAILTPPDIMTLGLLAGPMIILYEICVIIASVIERKREKRELAEEEQRRSRLERLYSTPSDDLSEEEKAELHRHEIEQYEKEHAHLYDSDGHEVDEHGHLIGYDPDHDEHHNHDDSWHDDHHYWHDGEEEADEPVDDEDNHHDDEDHPEPVQDWPDKDAEPEAESDHAEPTGEEEEPPDSNEEKETEESEDKPEDSYEDEECCEPSGPVVDMNHATKEELMDLPGVDDWLADMIIDHRPYDSFEDLEEIVGDDKVMEWMERLMLG